MGMAVIRGPKLIAYGVHQLRNGREPHDLIGQAKNVLHRYVRDFGPTLVAVERPLLLPTEVASLLTTMGQELHARGKALGCTVVELSAKEIRETLLGNPRANKLDVARALVKQYVELGSKLPASPARSALGWKARDRYWLHAFDALASAVAARGCLDSKARDASMKRYLSPTED